MNKILSWVAGRLGVDKIVDALDDSTGTRSIVEALIRRVNFTDLLGHAISYAYPLYLRFGRKFIQNAATIKTESLERWAKQYRPNEPEAPAEVFTAFRRLAYAFADAVESLVPKK